MKRAYVIADDLTGAADTGLPFWSRGLSATVLPLAADDAVLPNTADVVVLSTETRGGSEAEASATVGRLAGRLAPRLACVAPPPLLYKKVDSTLRGWVGAEVRALLDALPGYAAWVVPSYPKLGRRMENGVYTVHGRPLAQTEFARDISGCPPDSRVVPLLETQIGERVGFVPFEILAEPPDAIAEYARRQTCHRRQTRVVLFDAATDEQIARIVAAGDLAGSPVLWVGSAGLAGPLAARLGGAGAAPPPTCLRFPRPALSSLRAAGTP